MISSFSGNVSIVDSIPEAARRNIAARLLGLPAVPSTARGVGTHLAWAQEFENPEVAARVRGLSATANEQNLDRLEAVLASEGM